MKIEKWDDIHGNTTSDDRMVAFLESSTDSYAVLQLKRIDETDEFRFMPYWHIQKLENQPTIDHYEVVYFDVTFNDAIGEIAGNDERYAELQSVADEAVHTLAGIVGKSNTALWEQCEHTINSLYTLQLQLVKLAYLRGAEDREKMLR